MKGSPLKKTSQEIRSKRLIQFFVFLVLVWPPLISAAETHLVDLENGTVCSKSTGLQWVQDANLLKTLSLKDPGLIRKIIAAVPDGVIRNTPNYWDRSGKHVLRDSDFGLVFNSSTGWYDSATWWGAHAFVIYLNHIGHGGYRDWRLPEVRPLNGERPNHNSSFDGSTDYGYNIVSPSSEMAYLFHVELGNKGFYRTNGVPWVVGTGLQHSGPFRQMNNDAYWLASEDETNSNQAWNFAVVSGLQSGYGKHHMYGVWVVRTADCLSH